MLWGSRGCGSLDRHLVHSNHSGYRTDEYLYLCVYDSTNQCMRILDSVHWDYSKRKILEMDYGIDSLGYCYTYVCEAMFDSAITVEGDFYVAGSTWTYEVPRSPNIPLGDMPSFYAVVSYSINYLLAEHLYGFMCRPSTMRPNHWAGISRRLDSIGTFPPGFDSVTSPEYNLMSFRGAWGPFFPIVNSKTIDVSTSDPRLGRAWPSGNFADSAWHYVYAEPTHAGRFLHWENGDTNRRRSIFLTQDTVLTAFFTAKDTFRVTVVADSVRGDVSGGGLYFDGDTATLTVTPHRGHLFLKWSDDSTCNPRRFAVVSDTVMTPVYEDLDSCHVVAEVNDTAAGHVRGAGLYYVGEEVHLVAVPKDGYAFDHWNDGAIWNARFFDAEGDTSFVAYFVPKQGIVRTDGSGADFELLPNPARGSVVLTVGEATPCDGRCHVAVVDAEGRTVLSTAVHDRQTTLNLGSLPAGIYYVSLTTPQGVSTRKLAVEN